MIRRAALLVAVCTIAFSFIPTHAYADAGGAHAVSGSLTGPGGFQFPCGGIIEEFGSGSYDASFLGSGTYAFDVCIYAAYPFSVQGEITFTSANGGATLTGAIDAVDVNGGGPAFAIVVTGGTKRFAHASGNLTIGPLSQSGQYNCNFEVDICLNWTDTGAITGSLALH